MKKNVAGSVIFGAVTAALWSILVTLLLGWKGVTLFSVPTIVVFCLSTVIWYFWQKKKPGS